MQTELLTAFSRFTSFCDVTNPETTSYPGGAPVGPVASARARKKHSHNGTVYPELWDATISLQSRKHFGSVRDYTCPARAPGSVHGGPGSMNIDPAFTGPPATGKDPRTKAHRPLTGPRLNLRARGCLFDARWRLPARIPRGKAPRGSPDTRTSTTSSNLVVAHDTEPATVGIGGFVSNWSKRPRAGKLRLSSGTWIGSSAVESWMAGPSACSITL
jgi:hypothetical protein